MKLDIEVTQQDCEDGVRRTEVYCVVANAIKRQLTDANFVQVNRNTIRFTLPRGDGSRKSSRFVYRTPDVVAQYVRDFDAGTAPKPMKFTLEHPQIAEKTPVPKLKAKTASFKAQSTPRHRSVRVFGEKALRPVETSA